MSMLENKTLYHFVGYGSPKDDESNFELLCQLLTSDQVGRPGMPTMRLEIDPTRAPRKGELLGQSITCYCDIPFEDLALHTAKYGRFGIGLDRVCLSRFGARPVMYVPVMTKYPAGSPGEFLSKDARALLAGVHAHLDSGSGESTRTMGAELRNREDVLGRLVDTFYRDFLAFAKFYDGDLPIDHSDCFYTEREWRKFGAMPIKISLVEIVVPGEYEARMASRFPTCRAKIRTLD